jgi:hypothetical protein
MSIEKTVNVSGGAFVDPPQVHVDPVSEPGEAFVLATENPGVHVIGRGIDGRVDEERAAPEAAHKILALRTIFLPEHRIAIGVVLMPLGEWSVGIVQDGGAQVVVVPVVSQLRQKRCHLLLPLGRVWPLTFRGGVVLSKVISRARFLQAST